MVASNLIHSGTVVGLLLLPKLTRKVNKKN